MRTITNYCGFSFFQVTSRHTVEPTIAQVLKPTSVFPEISSFHSLRPLAVARLPHFKRNVFSFVFFILSSAYGK